MSRPLNVAVIGLGVGLQHLLGYEQLPHVRVLALVDLDEKRLNEVAKEHKAPYLLTDYRKALELEELDAVSVCTPNRWHAPISIEAMEAGKHVLVEKPMAVTVREAKRMVAVAKERKRKLMVGYCTRFKEQEQFLKRLIDAGLFGEIYFAKTGYVRRRGIPRRESFRLKASAGGGAVLDLAVHALDKIWWFMGEPEPISVCGVTYAKFLPDFPSPRKSDVEDFGAGFIRFANGAALMLEACWASHRETQERMYGTLYGTKAGAEFIPFKIFTDMAGQPVDIEPPVKEISWSESIAREVAHFVDSILNDRTPIGCGEEGLQVMRMLEGLYRSAQTGREVRV